MKAILIIIWALPALVIGVVFLVVEINFRREVKSLNEEFRRESRNIDRMEEVILSKIKKRP